MYDVMGLMGEEMQSPSGPSSYNWDRIENIINSLEESSTGFHHDFASFDSYRSAFGMGGGYHNSRDGVFDSRKRGNAGEGNGWWLTNNGDVVYIANTSYNDASKLRGAATFYAPDGGTSGMVFAGNPQKGSPSFANIQKFYASRYNPVLKAIQDGDIDKLRVAIASLSFPIVIISIAEGGILLMTGDAIGQLGNIAISGKEFSSFNLTETALSGGNFIIGSIVSSYGEITIKDFQKFIKNGEFSSLTKNTVFGDKSIKSANIQSAAGIISGLMTNAYIKSTIMYKPANQNINEFFFYNFFTGTNGFLWNTINDAAQKKLKK
jgi:hypothetical protein